MHSTKVIVAGFVLHAAKMLIALRRPAASAWITAALFALMIGCGSSLGVDPADLTGEWEFQRSNFFGGVTILQDTSGALTGTGREVRQCAQVGDQFCQFVITFTLSGRYQHPSVSFVLSVGGEAAYRFEGRLMQCDFIAGSLMVRALAWLASALVDLAPAPFSSTA